jgi:branched-chain amino acid transport system permease protein
MMRLKGNRGTWGFWGVAILIFIVGQLLISTGALNDFWKTIILIGGVMAIVSLGLNLIYGFNGQFSLGQWVYAPALCRRGCHVSLVSTA